MFNIFRKKIDFESYLHTLQSMPMKVRTVVIPKIGDSYLKIINPKLTIDYDTRMISTCVFFTSQLIMDDKTAKQFVLFMERELSAEIQVDFWDIHKFVKPLRIPEKSFEEQILDLYIYVGQWYNQKLSKEYKDQLYQEFDVPFEHLHTLTSYLGALTIKELMPILQR